MSPPRALVIVVGSLNADLTVHTQHFPRPGQTVIGSDLVVAPGGKGANQAVAASILGADVKLHGAVGADPHGVMLLRAAAAAGVDVTSVIKTADHPTGTAMIVVDTAGENTIIVSGGANDALTPASLQNVVRGASVLCLSLEIPVPTVQAATEHARDGKTQVILNLSPYTEVPPGLLRLTDVVIVNEHEATQLLGMQDTPTEWAEALPILATKDIQQCIVTRGEDGATVLAPAARQPVTHVEGLRVSVVDTTGCGDAFTGAIAAKLAAGATLPTATSFAVKASAAAATMAGAQSSYAVMRGLAPGQQFGAPL